MISIQLSHLESFLLQAVFYAILWLGSEYIASLVCIIVPVIGFFILVVSLLSELVEKSKVPKTYFSHMLIIIITPILIGVAFNFLYGGDLDWLKPI